MKFHSGLNYSSLLAFGLAGLLAASDGLAATKYWTNSASGFWGSGSTNWGTNGVAPIAGDTALITNAVTKTVTVDTNSASANLIARNLTLSAPVGATNTLLIVGYAASQAFQLNGGNFTINRGGTLITSNASFTNANLALNQGAVWSASNSTVRFSSGASFDNNGGAITQDGGTMDLGAASLTRIGRYSTNTAAWTVNSGTVTGTRMQIGNDRSLGTLNLSNGVVTLSSYLELGYSANGNPSSGGTGILNVVGGQLRVTNDVTNIGSRGPGRLNVSGGTATFALLTFGEVAGVQGIASVSGGQLTTVPGTVPVQPITNIFRVGNQGSGELDISGGVVVSRTELSIADNTGSTGVVAVTDGQLFSTNDLSSIGKYGVGQMTVSGGTVVFTNTSVGRHDTAVGTLTVQSNGNFYALDAVSIGRFTNSSGHVFVQGGLLSLTNDAIWVGREGAGDLTVTGGAVRAADLFVGKSEYGTNTPAGSVALLGGTTLLTSNLVIGTSLVSTGNVSMLGGNLTLANAAVPASFNVAQGSFTLSNGVVAADNLFLTNTGGQFIFSGGTLAARNLTAANGVPFVVGDGVSSAVFQLQGGVYSFADGLVISPNATVTGCGTVIGTIVNNGTYTNSCGGSSPPPTTISTVGKSANTVTISCVTTNGASYTLEYKLALTDPIWTPILPVTSGTGSPLNLTDSAATNATRFYRVRVQ